LNIIFSAYFKRRFAATVRLRRVIPDVHCQPQPIYLTYSIQSTYTLEQEQCSPGIQAILSCPMLPLGMTRASSPSFP
jgi:hypothetical protein